MRIQHYHTILVALICSTTLHAQAPQRRPMVVNDLFNIQTLSEIQVSPDGTSIAIVIQRAWSDPETFRPYSMFGNDHADIWIMPADSGPARNITHGRKDGSGYWNPVWSPNGQRLALLSTAGGDNVRLYVWEKNSGQLKRLSNRGVDLRAGTNAAGDGFQPFQWVDERRLLVIVLPEGEQPLEFRLRRQTQRYATEAWAKAAKGISPTSSILESGTQPASERLCQLLLIDVVTNQKQILAEGSIRHALLSPDREHVAIIAQARPPIPPAGQLRVDRWSAPSRLGIASLRSHSTVRWVEGLVNPVIGFGTHPYRWSPRGSALAVLTSERTSTGSSGAVFLVSPKDRSIRRVAENLVPTAVAWGENEQLLVRARNSSSDERSDWWLVANTPNAPRNLTEGLQTAPSQLVRTSANEVIGLANGTLWIFDLTTGSHRTLMEKAGLRVTEIVWPGPEVRATSTLSACIVRAREGDAEYLLRLDLSSSKADVSKFHQPAKSRMLVAYHPGRNLALFAAPQDDDGTFIWSGTGGRATFRPRIALNQHLAGIAAGERILIDYQSTDGKALKGMLLLPVGYQKGQRYPLVTWVYPGYVIRDLSSGSDW